ncbi:MAG: hypothetical protein IT453_13635 [Planctomycetes bacterium]|nr:hypothetical protein [Planctomycetota bacterium]
MHTLSLAFVLGSFAPDFTLQRVAEYDGGVEKGAEIVSVQSSTSRAVLLNADSGTVDVLDLADPAAPKRIARHALELAPGEKTTSVAFHPREDWFVVAVQGVGVWSAGRVDVRDAKSGAKIASFACGVGPDSVVFDASGRFAALACEGEGYDFDPKTRTFRSPPGSVTWLDFADGPKAAKARTLTLPGFDDVPGVCAKSDARRIEREVDWNGNGKIDEHLDFDGDGSVTRNSETLGTYEGWEVRAEEEDGEVFSLPLFGAPASAVEPECLAFSPDASRLYVTLQEVNACAVIDVATGELVARFGVGVARHVADTKKDGQVDFATELVALREPDGIALTPDGRFFVTGDEGDTAPKVTKVVAPGRPCGGRTLAVFDASSGALVGDTANQLDAAAAAAGLYPDDRSEHKGSEPEMVLAFAHAGRSFAVVGLERAGGLALVDLAEPAQPKVLGVAACGADAKASKRCEPEGLALHRRENGELYVLSANEGSGTLTVFALRGG